MRLHEQGIAVPSYTVLEDRFAIRVCITNHRSRKKDFDLTVREILRLGREVEEEQRVIPDQAARLPWTGQC